MPKNLLILFPLLLCAAPASFAANTKANVGAASQSAGEKSAQPKFASREELRSCMEGEDEIKQRNAQLERRHTMHNAELKALQDQSTAFYATEDKVDVSDEKQLAAFNERVTELNQQVDALNQRGARLTEEVKLFRADMRAHNQRCAALVYKIIDKDAIVRERKNKKPAAKE